MADPRGHTSFARYLTSGSQNIDSTYSQGSDRGTKYSYDSNGRTATVRDATLSKDTTAHDLQNRVLYSAKGGHSVTYTYNFLYLTSITDAKGQQTLYAPNTQGWVTSETDPRSTTTSYTYDAGGNPVSMTTRNGATIAATYDGMGRKVTQTVGGQTTTYYTDPGGAFASASNATGSDTVKFDLAGRAKTMVSVRSGHAYTQDVTLDAEGRRRGHQLQTGPQTTTALWDFNVFGRLKTMTEPLGSIATRFTYDAESSPDTIRTPGLQLLLGTSGVHAPNLLDYGNGTLNREYAYEKYTGLTSDRIRPDSSSGLRYEYDALGQLLFTKTYTASDPNGVCRQVVSDTGEINPACDQLHGTPAVEASFYYDLAGNRLDHSATVLTGNRVTSWFGKTLAYDDEGNLTQKQLPDNTLHLFTWTADGTLTKVVHTQSNGTTVIDTVGFTYDALGRRASKAATGKATVRYLYDGDNLLAQLNASDSQRPVSWADLLRGDRGTR